MSTNARSPRVLLAGASGYIGSALSQLLTGQGYQVTTLVRKATSAANQVQWDPAAQQVDGQAIEEADVVINLGGVSIAGGWWTAKRKQQILQSRLDVTSTLANAIAAASSKPSLFISTSAVGYYGDRPGETLDESSAPGDMFLSEVCTQWEAAADPARDAGVRVAHPRFGVVFSGDGGMLPLISTPFKLALGASLGGDQHMAWIDLHDLLRILTFTIENEALAGPINTVAPEPTTNKQFTMALADALNRPAFMRVPKAIVGTAGGQLARELLLADQKVVPNVLLEQGFDFERPTIASSMDAAFAK